MMIIIITNIHLSKRNNKSKRWSRLKLATKRNIPTSYRNILTKVRKIPTDKRNIETAIRNNTTAKKISELY